MSDTVGRIEQLTTSPPSNPLPKPEEVSPAEILAAAARSQDADSFLSAEEFLAGLEGEEPDPTVIMPLMRGKEERGKIEVRRVPDAQSILAIESRVKQLAEVCASTPHPDWKPFLPVTEDVLRYAVYIERCLVRPTFTFLDCLKMARRKGLEFLDLGIAVQAAAHLTALAAETKAINAEKNGSGETGTTATPAPSPATFTADTLTD